ncbi:hypothetical protein K466DRAFT_277946 [Polyporus arcularius HHB13444]|uniref:Uncharacterized protein n=1 Tax=Polyporus arcularius HHB13444 TaxID=1314778 RepID=A0A5C3PVJ3_9APHY|nr:hypothetical protein K466DRAFT_277946 [Polyporus arcularius HHB13444]
MLPTYLPTYLPVVCIPYHDALSPRPVPNSTSSKHPRRIISCHRHRRCHLPLALCALLVLTFAVCCMLIACFIPMHVRFNDSHTTRCRALPILKLSNLTRLPITYGPCSLFTRRFRDDLHVVPCLCLCLCLHVHVHGPFEAVVVLHLRLCLFACCWLQY